MATWLHWADNIGTHASFVHVVEQHQCLLPPICKIVADEDGGELESLGAYPQGDLGKWLLGQHRNGRIELPTWYTLELKGYGGVCVDYCNPGYRRVWKMGPELHLHLPCPAGGFSVDLQV